MPRQRGRKWWGVALANLAVLALLVALFELATRLIGLSFPAIARPGATDRGLWVYDARKGWFHTPHARGTSHLGGPDAGTVRLNSLGLRGPDVLRPKPPGLWRTLVFGDSFVFGVGVDEEHLLSAHLARLLDRSFPGRRHEVVNMGVSGYSTDQELLLFEDLGSALAPDLVVVISTDNDFAGNLQDFAYQAYYKPYYARSPHGGLDLRNVPVPRLSRAQEVKLWLGRHSNAWNAFRSRRSDSQAVQSVLELFQVAVPRPRQEDPVQLMHAVLSVFRRRAEGAGAGFVVFNTGHRGERTPLFQDLRPLLRQDGFRFLGLEGTLGEARAREPGRHWDFGLDSHWNVDAHWLAAEVVHEYVKKAGLVQAPPRRERSAVRIAPPTSNAGRYRPGHPRRTTSRPAASSSVPSTTTRRS